MNLDLFNQRPNPPIASSLGDSAVKGLVRLMESIAIAGSARFALALELREESDDLAALGALGGEPRRCLFERLANDDRLGKRGKRNARGERARLRENLDEPLVSEFAQRLADWRSAEAVRFGQLRLRERLARQPFERDKLGAQVAVDPGSDPAGVDAARPGPSDRSRLRRRERSQRTRLDLISALPSEVETNILASHVER